MVRLLLLLVAVGAFSASALAERAQRVAGLDSDATRWLQLVTWLAAADRHQAGAIDALAIEIASWSDARLNTVVSDVAEAARFLVRAHTRLGRSGQPATYTYARRSLSMAEVQQLLGLTDDEARVGDISRLVGRAGLLHTDIAVASDRLEGILPSAASSGRPAALLVLDGRQLGTANRGPHWGVARSLFDLVPADSPHADQRRRWYVATAAFMRGRSHLADMVPHLQHAVRLLPSDPEILFFSGAMHETMAAPFLQAALRDLATAPGTKLDITSARTHLQEARRFFARALDANADHAEARVRHGRVLGLLGQHEQAARELERSATAAAGPLLRYYAALFLGAEYAQLRKFAAARDAYQRAAALYPRAQSPRLGLSSLSRAEGNRAGAMAELAEVLGLSHLDDSRDPWWMYFTGPREAGDRTLDDWRRSVASWARR